MKNLAITLRAAQLFTHAAHNTISGCTFFSDHEFLGELYGTYEEVYDAVVERMIGLGQAIDLQEITRASCAKSLENDASKMDSTDIFVFLLSVEADIRKWAESYNADASFGSKNFLQGIADDSEMRSYKIGQRAKAETEEDVAEGETSEAAPEKE